MKPFLARLRRVLLLLPAGFEAGPRGLSLAAAVKLTGARSERELLDDVTAVGSLDIGPSMPEDFVVVSVEDGRVIVDAVSRFVAPPPLSLREGAALLAALRPLDGHAGAAVSSAVKRLRRAVPESLREEAERLARGTDFLVAPPGEWASALEEAIERRLEAEVEYRAENVGASARRRLEPRLLFPQDGHWYLAAWNVEKGEEHLYRLDRIVSVVLGTRTFAEHRGPDPARYRARHLYFQSGNEREVKVRFDGAAAPLARERWPEAEERPGGSVAVTTRVAPGNYLYGWVLGWGGQAEIEAPPEAREGLRERVEELAGLYRE
ncbi:MAG: WYL domain-containing protein [Deltaproteobacteria bacterium]|nr:WYL domain-containing protein [Deltaproteobacteria bacterium]